MPHPNRMRTRCFKCGSNEHTTSQCNLERRVCFQCREPGHESKACPWRHLNRTCGGCGRKGHIAQDCGAREEWICKNCAEQGHGYWECTKPKGYRRKRCHLCHSFGHTAPNCENRTDRTSEHATKTRNAKRTKKQQQKWSCAVCGGVEHADWECAQMPCLTCGRPGHKSSSCFMKSSERTTQVPNPHVRTDTRPSSVLQCVKCGSHQHDSRSCFIFQDETNRQTRPDEPRVASPTFRCADSSTKRRERTYTEQIKHDKAQSRWRSAEHEFLKQNYERALTLLAEAIVLDPQQPEYYIARAKNRMKVHDYPAALQDFEFASTTPTYSPCSESWCHIARCRLFLGSPSSALLAVKDALALNGANGDAFSLRRRILELEGHMDAYRGAVSRSHWRMARSAYESCVSVYAQEKSDAPGHIQCWGVELLIVEGKWRDAMKSVDILLKEIPGDVDAMTLRALTLFLDAKPSEALVQLATVLKLDPDNGMAKTLRSRVKEVRRLKESGDSAFQRNDYRTAIASWDDALSVLGKRDEEGHGGILRAILLLDRATALCKVREFAEGLRDINESLQLRPDYYKAFLCRARIMVGLELFETAAEDFCATLEHGKTSMGRKDERGIQDELEDAEWRAKVEGSKGQDHYVTLGLNRICTAVEIKKAYRLLSLKHHPDKGGVAEKFKQIARAYEVLSDPDQRREYDANV